VHAFDAILFFSRPVCWSVCNLCLVGTKEFIHRNKEEEEEDQKKKKKAQP